MAKSGESRANANRRIRQEALREQLSNGGHVDHVIEMVGKLADLDTELDALKIQRLRGACDIKMKLINKYLSDTKSIEHSNDPDNPMPSCIVTKYE